ncbi:DUF6153 family protein [Microbispora catharanthi]|uniref:DUF6153 family protein n=1 Tax=Microbispora catharanthi TaxID=1712871 RepID=UPI003B831C00
MRKAYVPISRVSAVTTGNVARRLAPWSGLLLLAAVLCGLFAMHGLQPSPGPLSAPSILTLHTAHTGDSGMPTAATDTRHDGGQSFPHDGHSGSQVCLAFLLAGSVLLLLFVTAAMSRFVALPARLLLQRSIPHGPTVRPRGPTLAQLCVIRV